METKKENGMETMNGNGMEANGAAEGKRMTERVNIGVEPGATVEEVEALILERTRGQIRRMAEEYVRRREAQEGAGAADVGGEVNVNLEGEVKEPAAQGAEEGMTPEKRGRLLGLLHDILGVCGDAPTAVAELARMLGSVMAVSVVEGKEQEAVAAVARELEARILFRKKRAEGGND